MCGQRCGSVLAVCTVECVFVVSGVPVLGVCILESVCGECSVSLLGVFTVQCVWSLVFQY